MVKRRDLRLAVIAGMTIAASLAGGPSACSTVKKPPGGLLLVIAEDQALGLDRIRVEIASKGVALKQSEYRLPAEAQLPTSLAIASNGDPSASVQITVIGWRGDVPVDRRDHVVEQVPTDRVAALAVILSARCTSLVAADASGVTSRCAAGETCNPARGTCNSARVSATTLPTATTIEGALADGGLVDGSPDGGKPDAGIDAGVVDNFTGVVLADGPRAYFRFEETTGPACKNEGFDTAVTCVYGGADISFGVPGSGGGRKGARLDTKAAQINMFSVMDYADQSPFTIEAWVRFDPVTPDDTVFNNQSFGAGIRGGRSMGLTPTDARVRTETWADGGLVFYTLTKSPPAAQTWTHVVYGYSPTLDRDFLYVDATLGEGSRVGTGAHVAPDTPLSWTSGTFTLDDVAIYSKVLTPAQIGAHFVAR